MSGTEGKSGADQKKKKNTKSPWDNPPEYSRERELRGNSVLQPVGEKKKRSDGTQK